MRHGWLAAVLAAAAALGSWCPAAQADSIIDLTAPAQGALATTERPLEAAFDGRGSLTTVWTETDATATPRVRALTVAADGTRYPVVTLSDPLTLGYNADQSPAVVGLPQGGAAVAWTSPFAVAILAPNGSLKAVHRLGGGGAPPDVAVLPDGDVVAAGRADDGLEVVRIDANGIVGRSLLDRDSSGEVVLDALPGGAVRAAWSAGTSVKLATVSDGAVSDPITVLQGNPNGTGYVQLALAGSAEVPVVAALNCFNNGAGRPCWTYTAEMRVVRDGTPECLSAPWAVDQFCSGSPSFASSDPVAATTASGFTVLAWTAGSTVQGVALTPSGALVPVEPSIPLDPKSLGAASAIRELSEFGQRPASVGVLGNALSIGRAASETIAVSWGSRGAQGESDALGYRLLWAPDGGAPSVAANVSAGGTAVSRPVVADRPRWSAAYSGLVWARDVEGQGRMLQAYWMGGAQQSLRTLLMTTEWGGVVAAEDPDVTSSVGAPVLAVTDGGRSVAAWWRDQGGNRWALMIGGLGRDDVPTPVVAAGSAMSVSAPTPPVVVTLDDSHAAVLWTGTDSLGTPRVWEVVVGPDGAAGVPRDLFGAFASLVGASRSGGEPAQLYWNDPDGRLHRARLDPSGATQLDVLVTGARPTPPTLVALPDGRTRAFWVGEGTSVGTLAVHSAEIDANGTQQSASRVLDSMVVFGSARLEAQAGSDGTVGVVAQFASGSQWPVFETLAVRISPDGAVGSPKMLGPPWQGQRGPLAVTVEEEVVTVAAGMSPTYSAPALLRVAAITPADRLEFASSPPVDPGELLEDAALTRDRRGGPLLLRVLRTDERRTVDAMPLAGLLELAAFGDSAVLAQPSTRGTVEKSSDPARPRVLWSGPTTTSPAVGQLAAAANAGTRDTYAAFRDSSNGIRLARAFGAASGATDRPPSHNGIACPRVWVLTVRGSGEQPGESGLLNAFVGHTGDASDRPTLAGRLAKGGLIGEVVVTDVSYPAVSVADAFASIAEHIATGSQAPPDYFPSVARGVDTLTAELKAITEDCGQRTRFVVAGYSQGAHVVGDMVQAAPANVQVRILATVLFADPKFNPAEPASLHGSFEPGRAGLFLPRPPTLRASVNGHAVLSYCRRFDAVCQGIAPGCVAVRVSDGSIDVNPVHVSYEQREPWPLPDGWYLLDPLALAVSRLAPAVVVEQAIRPPYRSCSSFLGFQQVGEPKDPDPVPQSAAREASGAVLRALGLSAGASAGAAQRSPRQLVAGVEAHLEGEHEGPRKVRPGGSVTFDASRSSAPAPGIARLDWDLDGDGSFERFGLDRVATARYDAQPSGPVRVRVRDVDGRSATASLDVLVDAGAPAPAGAPQAVRTEPVPGGFVVRWESPQDDGGLPVTAYLLGSADGAISLVVDGATREVSFRDADPGVPRGFVVRALTEAGAGEGAPPTAQVAAGPVPSPSPTPVSTVTPPPVATPTPSTVTATPFPTAGPAQTPLAEVPAALPTPSNRPAAPQVVLRDQRLRRSAVLRQRAIIVRWSQDLSARALVNLRLDRATARRLRLKVPRREASYPVGQVALPPGSGERTATVRLAPALLRAITRGRRGVPVPLRVVLTVDGAQALSAKVVVG